MRIERLKCDCCNVEGEPNSSWWIAGPILEDGEIGDNDYRWTIHPTYDVCGQSCLTTALARLASNVNNQQHLKELGELGSQHKGYHPQTTKVVGYGFTRYWESE